MWRLCLHNRKWKKKIFLDFQSARTEQHIFMNASIKLISSAIF